MTTGILLETIETLQNENRQLLDEVRQLRPLARLAHILSLMEGENAKLHGEFVKSDRDWQDVLLQQDKLEARIEVLENKSAGLG